MIMKRVLLLGMIFIAVLLAPSISLMGMSVQEVETPLLSSIAFGLITVVLTLSVFRILIK